MAKMSKTQRSAILGMFGSITPDADTRGYARLASTRYVLRVNGWTYSGRVTRSGLIAAGVDMDAIHAEALEMNGPWSNKLSHEGRQVVRGAAHAEAIGENEWWEARQADEQEEDLNEQAEMRDGHLHDMVESAMTDTCNYGCKVYRCWCGETEIRHYASYGCAIGRAEIA